MKVILQQNVQKLGNAGDVVESLPGYFRNFLQPRGLAVLATQGTLKKREEDLEGLKKKADKAKQELLEMGEKIAALGSIKLYAKAGDGGKLYGKITNKEIAQEMQKQLSIDVDKRLIKSVDEIGALGSYKVVVKLSPTVQPEVTVEVLNQNAVEAPVAAPAAAQ